MCLLRTAISTLLKARMTFAMLLTAIAVGVGLQLPNSANISGYTSELLRKGVAENKGHVVILPQSTGPFGDTTQMLESVPTVTGVVEVSPRCVRSGVMVTGEKNIPLNVIGIQPLIEEKAHGFCGRVEQGVCPDLGANAGILLGHRIAKRLGLLAGDQVRLVVPYESIGEVSFAKRKLDVVGVLAAEGFSSVDVAAFTHIELVNEMIDDQKSATSLHVWTTDPWIAGEVAEEISRLVPAARVKPWWDTAGFVSGAINGNETISTISLAMVMIAVTIPVLALLFIHGLRDRKNAAVLLAVGFRRRSIFALYFYKSVFVGVVGTIVGTLFGLGLCKWFMVHPIYSFRGFVIRPSLDKPMDILVPILAVLAVSILGGVIPAVHAAFINPTTELREV